MVAVIKAGHSMHRIFNYNENKVKDLEEKLENIVDTLGIELDDNVDISNAFDNYVKEALKNAAKKDSAEK